MNETKLFCTGVVMVPYVLTSGSTDYASSNDRDEC